MSWATAEQALADTGHTVATDVLSQASTVITLYAGVTEDMPTASITTRDRYWLRLATSYQAAWLASKPGYFDQRESHTDMSADNERVSRESEAQLMLAPLAARSLRNLSWIGTRSVRTTPPLPARLDFLNEASDVYGQWETIPGWPHP